MLAGRKEKRDVPHEEGTWFEFRTLSGRELDEAQEAATEKALRSMKAMGPEIIAAIQEMNKGQQAKTADSFDPDTLVRLALVAWSYPEPCNDEHKALLDGRTRDWAAAQIVEMNTLGESTGSAENSKTVKLHLNSGEPIDSPVSISN